MTSILDCLSDKHLFGSAFEGDSWAPWKSFLACLFGLPATDAQASLARALTGRQDVSNGPFRECWAPVGRRSGKSRVLAAIGCYLACFVPWRHRLAPGEIGVVMLLASDKSQAAVLLAYCSGLLASSPLLHALVTSETSNRIELGSLRVAIEVHVASYRSVRGRTLVAALLDEVAFWSGEESALPATETVRALRPALASLAPDSLLIGVSSPYRRSGLLWDQYRKHFGREGDRVLVWQAGSTIMNPSLPAELVADALEEDPEGASAEFLADFRKDIADFVSRAAVEAATIPGRFELPRCTGVKYHCFTDSSGGSADSFTLAIAHNEDKRSVLDCIREVKPPFSPEQVVDDFAAIIKSYGCNCVTSDKYGGVWVAEAFGKHAVTCEQSAAAKSDLYGQLLPALNSWRIELLDLPRLAAQLIGLERKVSRSGRDSIDHGPGCHDDLINAAAGALTPALAKPRVKIDFIAQTHITQQKGVEFLNQGRSAHNWEWFPNGQNDNDWSW